MKKILALVLAAMLLMGVCSALAEAPEGYPEVIEGLDFGGRTAGRCGSQHHPAGHWRAN